MLASPYAGQYVGLYGEVSINGSDGATYRLVTHEGRPAIRLTLDEEWLTARDRAFPVRVDPPVPAFVSGNAGGTIRQVLLTGQIPAAVRVFRIDP